MFGYWGTFDVDFYSYITTSEIVIISMMPFFSVGISTVIGMYLGSVISENSEKQNEKHSKFTKNYRYSILLILLVSTSIFLFSEKFRWIVFPVMSISFATILILLSRKNEFVHKYPVYIFLLLVLPIQAFTYGKQTSMNIIEGKQYKQIVRKRAYGQNDNLSCPIYIGKIGEFIFTYDQPKKTVMVDNIKSYIPFELVMHKKNRN